MEPSSVTSLNPTASLLWTQDQALNLRSDLEAPAQDPCGIPEAATAHHIFSCVQGTVLHLTLTTMASTNNPEEIFQVFDSCLEMARGWMGASWLLPWPLDFEESQACYLAAAAVDTAGVSKHEVGKPAVHQPDTRGVLPKSLQLTEDGLPFFTYG